MAKKEELSLEELLEQAIVNDGDRHYEVPGNWVWTRLRYVCSDFLVPQRDKPKVFDGDVPWCRIEDIDNKYLNGTKNNQYVSRKTIDEMNLRVNPIGTVICSCSASLGIVAIVTSPCCTNQTFIGLVCESVLISDFLYYYLKSLDSYFTKIGTGTTIPYISRKKFEEIELPLPSLFEQKRIVKLIESLFEKLDRAKEFVQNALDSFENRKSAILHKAFTGELTAKWREENGVELNWEIKILKSVADFRAGYAFDSTKFSDAGYQVIRMGNLYNGVLDLSRNPVFIEPEDIDENIVKRSKINVGDILLTLTGTKYKRDYGFAVLVTEENNIFLNQRILSLTAKAVETNYLLNYLKTDLFRDVFFRNETGGVNQGNVSSKFVETIEIPLPTLAEQKEIVRILDSLLEKEQKAEELCDVIDKIELMKKAILARAFRGGLGTNNPEEESAKGLLKQVLQEKINKG